MAPEAVDADAATVGTLVSTLESLEIGRVVDENPASVKEYGLDPAAEQRRASSSRARRRCTSSTSATRRRPAADLYARVDGQPKLFLIAAFNDDSLNRTTFDLRDKTILKFERDGVDSVTLEATGTPAISLTQARPTTGG